MKSTPVIENGGTSCTLIFGSGAESGTAYGLPPCFLQVLQRCSNFLTYCRPVGIQKDCLSAARVEPTPAWERRTCVLYTISSVRWLFCGSKYGNLASSLRGALWILPPQRKIPASSRNNLNCLTRGSVLALGRPGLGCALASSFG